MDIALFKWVPRARHHEPPEEPIHLGRLLMAPLKDRNFRHFLGYSFTLTFAIGYVGQFIWLYLFDVVGMTNMQANVMLVALPLLVSMLSFPMWGRLIDRLGCRPVLLIAGLLIVHGGASWIFVTRESWWLGYMGSTIATAAWPGVELAMFNLLLKISGKRSAQGSGSAYIAIHATVAATAGILSGLFGGVMAHFLRDWSGSIFGWPVTYHGLLLIISAGLRGAALLFLIGLHEPASMPTRNAIRYMVADIYGNVTQAIFAPMRGLSRMGRSTYRFIPRWRRGPEKR
jgi:MFS family permease